MIIKRNLPSLTPSSKYLVRVRAINAYQVASDWSEGLLLRTPADTTVPQAPTNLVTDFGSGDLVISWTPSALNVDGSQITDFASYRVKLTAGATVAIYETMTPSFVLTYAQNVAAFGGESSFSIEIRAVDTSGLVSTPLSGGASNGIPSNPSVAPLVVGAFTIISISMSPPVGDRDITGYDLYHATTVGGVYTLLASISGDTYIHNVAQGTEHHYKYKARDIFGQVSLGFSPVGSATTDSIEVPPDTTPPADVTGLSVTAQGFSALTQRSYAEVAWSAVADLDLGYYELRIKPNADTIYFSVVKGKDFLTHRFNDLLPNTAHTVQIRAVDVSGNNSAWSPVTPLGFTTAASTAPATPTGQTASGGVESIFVDWLPNSEVDLARYELYASTSDGFTPGSGNLKFTGNATNYVLKTTAAQTWYFKLRAINQAGGASAYTAQFTGTSVGTFAPDTTAPGVPSGLGLTTGQEFAGAVENVYVNATWTAPVDTDLAGYSVRIRKGSETRYTYQNTIVGVTSAKFSSLQPNTLYGVQVAAYDKSGNFSAYTTEVTITTSKDAVAPGVPANPTGTASLKTITWGWDSVVAADFSHYEAQVAAANTFAIVLFTFTGAATAFTWTAPNFSTQYYMRVRAIDFSGNVSAYSTTATATTGTAPVVIDTTPPALPTSLALTTGQEFNGQVENIYVNATWVAPADSDLAGYSVRLRKGAETRYEYQNIPVGIVAAKFTSLQANTSYGAQVAAYDKQGNYSAYTTEVTITSAKDSTAPGVPANPVGVASLKTITWSWDTVVAADLDGYSAQITTAADTGFATPLHTFTGSATSFAWTAPNFGAGYIMRVRSFDVSANNSAYSTTSATTTTGAAPFVADTTAPALPTSLALTTGQEFNGQVENVYINATWTAPADSDLAGYSVRIRKGAETRYTYQDVVAGNTSAKFAGLAANTLYGVQVAAFDKSGNYSAYTTEVTTTTAKDASAPTAPTGLALTAAIRSMFLQWTANTEVDLDRYEIHIGTAAAFTPSATNLYAKPAQGTMETINKYHNGSAWVDLVPGATYYVKMYAVDISSNKSPVSAEVSAAAGQTNTADYANLSIVNAKVADLAVDKVTAGTLSAVVTVSGTIRTATSGARMEMTSTGLIGYATDGTTKNFEYKNSDGTVTIIGGVFTSGVISGGTIDIGGADTTSFHVDSAGAMWLGAATFGAAPFSVTSTGALVASNATISGAAGTTTLSIGAGSSILKVDTSGLYLGNAVFASAPFRVSYAGAVVASNIDLAGGSVSGAFTINGVSSKLRFGSTTDTGARISITKDWFRAFNTGSTTDTTGVTFDIDRATGNVTITGGTLTTPSISGGSIDIGGADATSFHVDTAGAMWLGAATFGAAPFSVSSTGALVATNATISGAAGTTTLSIGSANSILKVDTNGLYMGNATFASAPFRVTYAGAIVASNIDLAGGSVSGAFTINGAASKLRFGSTTDTGARITITKDWFRAFGTASTTDATDVKFEIDRATGNTTITGGTFSAPTITGSTITGGTFQTNATPTTNGIIIEDTNGFRAYDTGVLRAQISRLGTATFDNVLITNAGKTSGFIINAGNFTVNYQGNVTAANITATGGQIGGTTFNATTLTGGIIAGSTINVENSGSINFTGSGKITWTAPATGGIELSNSGYINNAAYRTSNLTGFQLSNSGIVINEGTIKAAALQIGISSENLVVNSSFENGTAVATGWIASTAGGTSPTWTVDNTTSFFQAKSQKVVAGTGNTYAGVYQAVSYPTLMPIGTPVTHSIWFKQTVGTLRQMQVHIQENGGAFPVYATGTITPTGLNVWTRVVVTTTLTVAASSMLIHTAASTPAAGDTFFFDGAMATFSSFPVDYSPRGLEIPDNYIQSAYISSLTADKFATGTLNAATITVGATGYIQSFDWNGSNAGYRLSTTGATFQNGSVTVVGSGGATIIDSTSLRSIIGGGTKFLVNGTGVYIGGANSTDANVYFEGSKTVFQDTSGAFDFIIDTSQSKILRLVNGVTENFYLNKDGTVFFAGAISGSTIDIGGSDATSFHVDINGNLWSGDASFASAPFKVSNTGEITGTKFVGPSTVSNSSSDFLQSSNFVTDQSGWRITGDGSAEFQDVLARGRIDAQLSANRAINPLLNPVNLTGWSASRGVKTWLFDTAANVEGWVNNTGTSLTQAPTIGMNDDGQGGFIGSLKVSVNANVPAPTAVSPSGLSGVTVTTEEVTVSYWCRTDTPAPADGGSPLMARADIAWYNGAGTFISTTAGALIALSNTEWREVGSTGLPPVGAAYGALASAFPGAPQGTTFYVDTAIFTTPTNSTATLHTPAAATLDEFTRADSTTSLGGAWTTQSGVLGISSNRAYVVSGAGAHATLETGTANHYVEYIWANHTSGHQHRIYFRYVNSTNFWWLEANVTFGTIDVHKYVAGVGTQNGNLGSLTFSEAGRKLRIECDGNIIKIFYAGNLVREISDAANNTGTKVGIGQNTTGSGQFWDSVEYGSVDRLYTHGTNTASMKVASVAAGIAVVRTPSTLIHTDTQAVEPMSSWVMSAKVKNRRSNSSALAPIPVATFYTAAGAFHSNVYGTFGIGSYEWTILQQEFAVPAGGYFMRINIAFISSVAGQSIYLNDFKLQEVSVGTFSVLRTAESGPRIESRPTSIGSRLNFYVTDKVDEVASYVDANIYGMTLRTPPNYNIYFAEKSLPPISIWSIPHCSITQTQGNNGTSTTGSYANLPVRTRILSFVKARSDTVLAVALETSGINNDNGFGLFSLAVLINGTAYTIHLSAASGLGTAGFRSIAGIAAGTYDIEVQWKRDNATGNLVHSSQYFTNLMVTETY